MRRRITAIIGLRSSMPIGGMDRRMGARIGSVISCRKITTGLRVSMPTQRKMILMKMATINMMARI